VPGLPHQVRRAADLSALTAAAFVVAGCRTAPPAREIVYFPASPGHARVVHLVSFGTLRAVAPRTLGLRDMLVGAPLGPFVQKPAGLAWRDGHLYICDTGLNVVHDWDLAAGTARRLGGSGAVALRKPVAVAAAPTGLLCVADTERGEIVLFNAEGEAAGRLRPPSREGYRPTALAVRNNHLWVADIQMHQVDVFDLDENRYDSSFGGAGSDPGRLYFPMGLAIGPRGRLFVSDMLNGRVQVFDGRRQPVLAFGRPGDRYGDMGKPRHLAVAPDGVTFVADAEFAHVHLFDEQGRLLLLIGGPEDQPGGTPMPAGIAVAKTVPPSLAGLMPQGFSCRYYLFVSNTAASRPISLFAVGQATATLNAEG